MISQNVLSCQPELLPHAFTPSEDNPKEFILTATENGAALGITHAEKRLVELIDGKNNMAEIIERTIHEQMAPLSTLRRLIWDLYRYGFLINSPWEIENAIEGWGYWGKFDPGRSQFWIVPLLGPLERFIGRFLLSPFFHIATFILLAMSVWYRGRLFHTIEPLLICNSVAVGLLVVLISILGGALAALWMGAMVLRAIHPSPVRCASDYRYALPIFCLDGRRLRAFPARKAFHYAISPIVGILCLSSLFLFGAGISEGARMEGLLHICGSLWFTAFLLVIPWNSTLVSREVLLRIREESILGLVGRAVRRAFHYLFQSRLEDEPHDKLCLAWGIWAILGSLLFIRLATHLLRWEFPILVKLFLTEENRPVLITLITLVGILTAALLVTLLSFFFWVGREIIREIRNRYWPERDLAITGLSGAAALFVLTQYFLTLREGTILSSSLPLACCGILLTSLSLRSWRVDGSGFEPLVHLFPFSWGVLLAFHSMGIQSLPHNSGNGEIDGPFSMFIFTQPATPSRLWIDNILLIAGIVYWIELWRFCFKPVKSIRDNLGGKIVLTTAAILLCMGLKFLAYFPPGIIGISSQVLYIGLFMIAGAFSIWVSGLLNYSTTLLCGGSILVYLGSLRPEENGQLFSGSFLLCVGTLISIAGLVLRDSARNKIALLSFERSGQQTIRESWTLKRLAQEWKSALLELYHADVRLPIPNEITEDTMREYFARLHRLVGASSLYALMRRVACSVPWYATRTLIKILPASIPAPRLTDWTSERVEQGLRYVPTFVDLCKKEMAILVSRTRITLYKSGERLIHQGQHEGCMYVVIQGNLSVEMERPFGNRVIAVLSYGNFAGEIGFLSGIERTASVRAIAPSLLLCIHRNDIDEKIPTILTDLKQAETGNSWIKAFSQSTVFKEFPYSLSARICLESRHVRLERGESLWLESRDLAENIAVFLLGKGSMIKEGETSPLSEGMLVGLEASLADRPMQGIIRAEMSSHIMIVDRTLFREALAELLTPVYILESSGESSTAKH